jgi:putative addiction module CopG family antidote
MITLPSDMAAVVRGAVAGGDYASTSEVVREALRDWKMKRALKLQELNWPPSSPISTRGWRTWPRAG